MSQQHLSPYVNFGGRAREALEFYHKVLGGKVDLQAMRLEVDGTRILAADGHPDYPAKAGENMALAVTGSDKDRLIQIFNALVEGGTLKMQLTESEGWLTDKFGINWLVKIEKA